MAEPERMMAARSFPITVESCWLCGSRLPVDHMVADGGRACADVRWYCLDMRGCTERWVYRWSSPARTSQLAAAQLASTPAAVTGLPKRQPQPSRPAAPQQAAGQRAAAQRAAAQRAASGQAGSQHDDPREGDGQQAQQPAAKQLARQRGPRR